MTHNEQSDQSYANLSGRHKSKVPRKASLKSLENAAIYYLKRYASSAANLKSVLMRRVMKSARYHGTDVEAGRGWIDEVISQLQDDGYLDDRQYAETRVQSLYSRGYSSRAIRMKLAEKGVPSNVIDESLVVLIEESKNPELQAAITTARRRKLGPYRIRGDRQKNRDRDLASLARGGFSYDIAVTVVDTKTIEELEDEFFTITSEL